MGDNGKDNQPGCCEGGQCCSPTPTDAGRKSRRWKTLIFTAVLLLAGGVAAYSLFWRTPATPAACCPPGSAAAAACGESATDPGYDHTAAPTGLSLVVLLHVGDALSSEQMAAISDVRTAVETQGDQLQFQTLRFGDPDFLKVADQYGIAKFPALVVTGQSRFLVLGNDQVRADTILSAFERKASSTSPDSASPSGSL